MRKLLTLTAIAAALVMLAAGSANRAVAQVGVDGTIGAEWTGVIPKFVPFGPASPDGLFVAYNVYMRTDAGFCYIALEAVPAAGDDWDTAVNFGLSFGGNLQIDTDPVANPNLADININPLGGFVFSFAYGGPSLVNEADGDAQPLLLKAQTGGTTSGGTPPSVGGVQEIAIGWALLENDPDGVGFPTLSTANPFLILRRVQGFGNNFSGSQFDFDFGQCRDPNPPEPEVTQVEIDIKPASDPNSINSCSKGAIPVAILGSDTFDVADIDPDTLVFAGAGIKMVGKTDKLLCSVEDVNDDGFLDLVCHFIAMELADIAPGDASAVVEGELFDGTPIEGTDSINIVKDDCL